MNIRKQFPDIHWIWSGGISFVYEVQPHIVVKVPKSGDFEREQFRKELTIYEIFSQHPPCHSIVQCFLYVDNGIFLEYMRGRPTTRNILLDRNRLKLSDFDSTAEIGSDFEACTAPYGRVLNEQDEGRRGSSGFLGPRTEQFALGSLYYLINYGFEVYGDQQLTEDPKVHGCKVVELLQNMEFPLFDDIITKCWHNKYATVAELAVYTETLLERHGWGDVEAEHVPDPQWSAEDFSSKKGILSEPGEGRTP
ncbi:unnamed protein product [Penicillium salamii]|uniref:Protein kinase domain-containing protein n=1 Tax=Penicillium salamii TaxID=1612424 RepID=A0A9W4NFP4_9EURO|nr:unnamed protein product [Penicillium salamii]